jgi:hypothetical protein
MSASGSGDLTPRLRPPTQQKGTTATGHNTKKGEEEGNAIEKLNVKPWRPIGM